MIKILTVHNFYKQPGGEDVVFESETAMLKQKGHEVFTYTQDNDSIDKSGKASLFIKTLWNSLSAAEIGAIVRKRNIDIVHFHNTFPLISPAAYYAARRNGAAVVQTLHNFRLICPEARLFRNNNICELCIKRRFAFPSIKYACYRNNTAATATVALMLLLHRSLGTYSRQIDAYIALTQFARHKILEGLISADKIHIKPNFLSNDSGAGSGTGGFALFVGRLSQEKGIKTLAEAICKLNGRIPFKIAGDGPMRQDMLDMISGTKNVEYLGQKSHKDILPLMKEAKALVIPSLWYEGFPMTVVEAYAAGLPVIASSIGSLGEIVKHENTGLLFNPADSPDLVEKLDFIFKNPQAAAQMKQNARKEFETKYTSEINYCKLMDIYEKALNNRRYTKSGLI